MLDEVKPSKNWIPVVAFALVVVNALVFLTKNMAEARFGHSVAPLFFGALIVSAGIGLWLVWKVKH
jgi:hypothetical protein